MDNFGKFTESYGLKPQGKSAPMAALKRSTTDTTRPARNSNSGNGPYPDNEFGFFRSSSTPKSQNFGNFDDVFGGTTNNLMQSNRHSFDYDPFFKNLNDSSSKTSSNDDIFGGMPGLKIDDAFGHFTSAPKQNGDTISDLLGNVGGSKPRSSALGVNGFDDLIPGFGGRSPLVDGLRHSTTAHSTSSSSTLFEDPFIVLESTSSQANAPSAVFPDPLEELSKLTRKNKDSPSNGFVYDNTDPFDVFSNPAATNGSQSNNRSTIKTTDDAPILIPKIPPFKQSTNSSQPLKPPRVKPSQVSKEANVNGSFVSASTIDDLENFAMGKVRSGSASAINLRDVVDKSDKNKDNLDSFFSPSSRSRSAPRPRVSDDDFLSSSINHNNQGVNKIGKKTPSSVKKASPVINTVEDFSSIFGADLSGEQFEVIEGESEERRKARLGRHSRTNDRIAQAVADMNQRDLQIQREQEEKHRISETLDGEIKRWAAGKEGNLRALLSSLQLVLWSESGWQPVSLTDIITSASVKKVYRKATLCIHPDKVQQKGANLEQKYVAEKVFDILKEAWNKFNKEELS